MKEMSVAEVRQVQQSILDKVHAYCKDNGFQYFLAAGTLLGSVRHKGYIPWDDDIDIYMLRKDYDRLELCFNDNPPVNLRLMSLKTESKYTFAFIKIEDTTTALKEDSSTYQCGVNIDVFPVDGIPDDDLKVLDLYRRLSFFEVLEGIKSTRFSSRRSILKNLALAIGKLCLSYVSLRYISSKRDSLIHDYSHSTNKVGELSTFAFKKQFPRSLFTDTTDVLFEGKYYQTTKDWDKFLTLKFGNYMQLPPEEQRLTHHAFKAFWK